MNSLREQGTHSVQRSIHKIILLFVEEIMIDLSFLRRVIYGRVSVFELNGFLNHPLAYKFDHYQ